MPRGVRLSPEERTLRIAELERQREARRLVKQEKKTAKKQAQKIELKQTVQTETLPTIVGLFGIDTDGNFATRVKALPNVTVIEGTVAQILSQNPLVVFCADAEDMLKVDADPQSAGTIVAFASARQEDWDKAENTRHVWSILFGIIPGQGLVLGGVPVFSSLIASCMRKLFSTNELTKTKIRSMMIAQQARKESDAVVFCEQFGKYGELALELIGKGTNT